MFMGAGVEGFVGTLKYSLRSGVVPASCSHLSVHHETHEVQVPVVDHVEIDRLTGIIHELEHRPLEKEVVVETQTVMDHSEVNRLSAMLHQRD